jgi:hypothetical protein
LSEALRARLAALAVLAALAAGAAGCGDDDSGEPTPASSIPPLSSLEEPPPRGASPLLEDVYRQFQPPQPDPAVKGSAKALKRGEKTCSGKTPLQIREQFIGESDLTPDQAKTVERLPRYERSPSPNFVAGQLGALVYEGTLPEDELATYGFQGCIYALSLRLKRELAKGGGN